MKIATEPLMKSKIFLTLFLLLITNYWLPITSHAQRFSSDSYIIDMGNFNMTSGKKSSTTYQLTDTVGQFAPGKFSLDGGYIVKSGFQYIYDLLFDFSFKINNPDLAINFGTLTPDIGTTQSHTVTVSSPSGHGYDIYVLENHPLTLVGSQTTIPDTSCDQATSCTVSSSNVWNSPTAYGFGYNVSGIGATYFPTSSHYRPFATSGHIFMSENVPSRSRTASITYKVNILATQSAGNYENAITFIAIPKY
ncbi:MAG: hypothetical protein WC841_04320 [Candidatus Shapirobacteria bacterium]|jgi:hypothetical protein